MHPFTLWILIQRVHFRHTSITSRRLKTFISDESATMDILCRTSLMEREGDKDLWTRRGMLWTKAEADWLKMTGPNPKMIQQKIPDSWAIFKTQKIDMTPPNSLEQQPEGNPLDQGQTQLRTPNITLIHDSIQQNSNNYYDLRPPYRVCNYECSRLKGRGRKRNWSMYVRDCG